MKRSVFLRPRAEADLYEATRWYDAQRTGLGEEFLGVVDRAIHLLEERSEEYPIYYRNFRRLLLRRFPYKIFFQTIGDQVVIFRILHSKRDHPRHL